MELAKHLFWDTDYNAIDWDKHARYVIVRVLMKGTFDDWEAIKKYYGLRKIQDEIIYIRFLDKKTLNFCATYFGIPIKKFRCYTQKQSTNLPWTY